MWTKPIFRFSDYLCKGTNYLRFRMKRRRLILFALACLAVPRAELFAQPGGFTRAYRRLEGKDTVTVINISPVYVFPRKADTRRYAQLIYNLKKVYPIAKEANATLKAMENHLLSLRTKREQQAFVKAMERKLKEKYTPVLRQMTFAQGKILIKLIDRETNRTSYQLVKDLRGSFSAFMWQGVARIFGANLKDDYDRYGEDRQIEMLILLYEAGEI